MASTHTDTRKKRWMSLLWALLLGLAGLGLLLALVEGID
jgi:choline-glycine betaine transporter